MSSLFVKFEDKARIRKKNLTVGFRKGPDERSVVTFGVKDYMSATRYAKNGTPTGVKEKPRPWPKCPKYNRKKNARRQPVPDGYYRPKFPELLGICQTANHTCEAAQISVGFTLARNVRDEEEFDDSRPKCLVLVPNRIVHPD